MIRKLTLRRYFLIKESNRYLATLYNFFYSLIPLKNVCIKEISSTSCKSSEWCRLICNSFRSFGFITVFIRSQNQPNLIQPIFLYHTFCRDTEILSFAFMFRSSLFEFSVLNSFFCTLKGVSMPLSSTIGEGSRMFTLL